VRYCTECGDEFEDWVQECPDCHILLVRGPKPEVKKRKDYDDIYTMSRHTAKYDELVTIGTFSYPVQAHILVARLESEGIPAIIVDEHMSTLYFVFPKEVRVQVRESDVANARKIMDSIE
jgi:hypothetical protein